VSKPFVIRDPVHGYLSVAAHERLVVDHPITQRLRRITQTGLAEFVFPEARSSRFVHSLGAMHLASRFLISAVENADERAASAFFDELEKLDLFKNYSIGLDDLETLLVPDRRFGGGGLMANKVCFHDERFRNDRKFVRLLGLAESGLRLAALFHDLGHLPFSHDFEFALKDYVGQTPSPSEKLRSLAAGSPHETIGHQLAHLVFLGLVQDDKTITPAVRASFAMARRILDSQPGYDDFPNPNVDALGWLHSLVDGEIDVDRADYLLRDGRALGLEFASYDLDRLIHNLVLARHRTYGFVTAIDERGLTAVESFYISRARSHQVLVRHHKCAQLCASLRYASVVALQSDSGQRFIGELLALVEGGTTREKAGDLLKRFAEHDDPWWLGVLRQSEAAGDDENALSKATSDLVLRRQPTVRSLWKRKGDLSADAVAKLNGIVDAPELGESVQNARRRLEKEGVILILHRFRPYGVSLGGDPNQDSIALIRSGKHLRPVVQLSPLIRSLRDAWREDPHVHGFAVKGAQTSKDRVLRALLGLGNVLGNVKEPKKQPRARRKPGN